MMNRAVNLNMLLLQVVSSSVESYIREDLPDTDDKDAIEEMWLVLGTCDQLLNEYARLGRKLWISSHGENDQVAPAAWRANLPKRDRQTLHQLEVWIKVLKEMYPL